MCCNLIQKLELKESRAREGWREVGGDELSSFYHI